MLRYYTIGGTIRILSRGVSTEYPPPFPITMLLISDYATGVHVGVQIRITYILFSNDYFCVR